MAGIDSMFDFDGDGKLDWLEQAAEATYIMEELEKQSVYGNSDKTDDDDADDDDEEDIFEEAGLDYDELEMMDADERREVLEDAGLDPDEFDF